MPALEFCLPPEDLAPLLRQPVFARRGGRATPTDLVWHDTATGALAGDHVSLCEARSHWRLERASPRPGEAWPPGTPAPLVAEAAEPQAFGPLPGPILPIAGFHGERRVIRLTAEEPASLAVLHGVVRGVAQERPICRLTLEGPAPLLMRLSSEWAARWALTVPRSSVAVEAMAVARARPIPARHSGGPMVAPGTRVGDAVTLVVGHLTDVILAGVPTAASGDPDAVHAMRVAVRRLRSALSVFRHGVDAPVFDAMRTQLAELARTLGTARDWDVFLAGIGAEAAASMPGDTRLAALMQAAMRQRDAAYVELRRTFAAAAFRQLAVGLVHLAALRSWEIGSSAEDVTPFDAEVTEFASAVLGRQHRRMMQAGPDLGALAIEDLHALRKQGKRLRYTAEFFAPCFGERRTSRFLKRVEALQEALGALNDGASAAGLMRGLRGGPSQQFAAGVVQGFAAGRSAASRASVGKRWTKFRSAKPFWL